MQIQISWLQEANWSGSTLFAKTGHVVFSKRRIKYSAMLCSMWSFFIFTICIQTGYMWLEISYHAAGDPPGIRDGPYLAPSSPPLTPLPTYRRPLASRSLHLLWKQSKKILSCLLHLFFSEMGSSSSVPYFFFFIWVFRPFQEYFIYESIIHQRWAKTGENHPTIHKQNLAFPHVTRGRLEPQRWET